MPPGRYTTIHTCTLIPTPTSTPILHHLQECRCQVSVVWVSPNLASGVGLDGQNGDGAGCTQLPYEGTTLAIELITSVERRESLYEVSDDSWLIRHFHIVLYFLCGEFCVASGLAKLSHSLPSSAPLRRGSAHDSSVPLCSFNYVNTLA